MKISCLPVSLFSDISSGKMPLKDWAILAKEIGYDGYDLSMLMLTAHTHTYLAQIKEALKSVSIPIVMVTTYPDFTNPDPKQRQRELDYFMNDIAVCDELNVNFIRIVPGQSHPNMPVDKGIALSCEYMRHIDNLSKKYSVTLVIENHSKPGAWKYYDFGYNLEIFDLLVDELKDTDIKINFDIGNVVALGGDPLTLIEKYFDRIATVHISDIKKPNDFSPVAIGTGASPLKESLQLLKDKKYDGWLCIEEASFSGVNGIKDAYEFTRKYSS